MKFNGLVNSLSVLTFAKSFATKVYANNAISRNTIATAFSKTLQKTRSFRHYVNCNRDVQNTEYARPQKSQEF